MATLAELLTPVTVDEAKALILALLEAVGFPATAWQRFSVPRTFVAMISELYSDSRTGFTNIVMSRLLDLAEGDALTALAHNFYRVDRDPATNAVGQFLLTDTGGAPYTIEIGQLLVRDVVTNARYTNSTGGVLNIDNTLTLEFTSEGTGTSYNINNNSTLDFVETFEGVEVTNPVIDGTGTWRTTTATDEQTDDSLREECRNKWATVGAGTSAAYAAWAREGSSALTKVAVYDDEPNGAGTVLVVVATDAGEASEEEKDAADAVIQAKRPVGLRDVSVVAASEVAAVIDATVNVYSGADTYEAALGAALPAFQREIVPGMEVYLTRFEAFLHSPGNVRNVVITSPATTAVADIDQIVQVEIGTITINTVAVQ